MAVQTRARPQAQTRLRAVLTYGLPVVLFAVTMLIPAPAGLTPEGKRVLAVVLMAVALWSTDTVPMAVTGILAVVLLMLVRGEAHTADALSGFANTVPYFLLGILTLGLAMYRSGLAARIARGTIGLARGSPVALFWQMIGSFIVLTLFLPSASTRNAMQIHVYDEILDLWRVPQGHPLARALMLAMGALNRLASTALLTGGMAPVAAAALIGGMSWGRWFALMSVPYYVLLLVGAALIHLLYRRGFRIAPPDVAPQPVGRMSAAEWKALAVALLTAGLWFTDFLHGLPPVVPALIALVVLLLPRVGVLTWQDFEQQVGWVNFFALATSLSVATAMVGSGLAEWLASRLVGALGGFAGSPLLVVIGIMVSATVVRLIIPNIGGFLALVIPVGMSIAADMGLNPLVVALLVTSTGDMVLYYAAQAPSSLVVFARGHVPAAEVFRVGLLMTLVAYIVLLAVAIPWWGLVGERLVTQ